jgi:hypothetical protein
MRDSATDFCAAARANSQREEAVRRYAGLPSIRRQGTHFERFYLFQVPVSQLIGGLSGDRMIPPLFGKVPSAWRDRLLPYWVLLLCLFILGLSLFGTALLQRALGWSDN